MVNRERAVGGCLGNWGGIRFWVIALLVRIVWKAGFMRFLENLEDLGFVINRDCREFMTLEISGFST